MSSNQKVVGRVNPSEAGKFCDAGSIRSNFVRYGSTKKIQSRTRQLVTPKRRTVSSGPNGKDVSIQSCSQSQTSNACAKANNQGVEAVLLVDPNAPLSGRQCPPCDS